MPASPTPLPSRIMSVCFRRLRVIMLSLLVALMPATALAQRSKVKQMRILEQIQEDYSKAIRWNDFEGAWTLLDPEYRSQHPITDAEFSRYEQIQVTSFEGLDSRVMPDGSIERVVRIDVVNRNTLSQRSLRLTERWRYDAKTKRWWLSSGLPNFWQGR
jgi:hypothetical protein